MLTFVLDLLLYSVLVCCAFPDVWLMRMTAGRMSFKTFPPKDREVLSEFDANGDEKLDTAEISSAFRALKWERDKNASLVKYLTILGVFSIIMLTAFAGLTALVVHEMKDTKVNNDVLLSMQDLPIQTANTDFEMTTDGALQSRPFSSDGICVGDTSGCQRTRVTVAAVPVRIITSPVFSSLPLPALPHPHELTYPQTQ